MKDTLTLGWLILLAVVFLPLLLPIYILGKIGEMFIWVYSDLFN